MERAVCEICEEDVSQIDVSGWSAIGARLSRVRQQQHILDDEGSDDKQDALLQLVSPSLDMSVPHCICQGQSEEECPDDEARDEIVYVQQ